MKTFKIAAAVIAASIPAFTAAAFAQGAASGQGQGHYAWQRAGQYGPRAPLTASQRVWVPDATQIASCNCAMMQIGGTDAAACMKGMPGMASPSGASAG